MAEISTMRKGDRCKSLTATDSTMNYSTDPDHHSAEGRSRALWRSLSVGRYSLYNLLLLLVMGLTILAITYGFYRFLQAKLPLGASIESIGMREILALLTQFFQLKYLWAGLFLIFALCWSYLYLCRIKATILPTSLGALLLLLFYGLLIYLGYRIYLAFQGSSLLLFSAKLKQFIKAPTEIRFEQLIPPAWIALLQQKIYLNLLLGGYMLLWLSALLLPKRSDDRSQVVSSSVLASSVSALSASKSVSYQFIKYSAIGLLLLFCAFTFYGAIKVMLYSIPMEYFTHYDHFLEFIAPLRGR